MTRNIGAWSREWVEPRAARHNDYTPAQIAYLASGDDDPYRYVPTDDGLDAIIAQARRDGVVHCTTLGELY
jgi:hypothetical protein